MHSSVHYREPQGKGYTLFLLSTFRLVEARSYVVAWASVPSLLFSYTMQGPVLQSQKLLFILSLLETSYQGLPLQWSQASVYLILRGNAFLFTFFPCECSVRLGMRSSMPLGMRGGRAVYVTWSNDLSVTGRTASFARDGYGLEGTMHIFGME